MKLKLTKEQLENYKHKIVFLQSEDNNYMPAYILDIDVSEDIIYCLIDSHFGGELRSTSRMLSNTMIRSAHSIKIIQSGIESQYLVEIGKLKSQFQSRKRSDYQNEIGEKYDLLKQTAINIAKAMVSDSTLTGGLNFENHIKEMAQIKKQLFAIECDGVVTARKHNGIIKGKLRDLKVTKETKLENLDLTKLSNKLRL